MAGLRALWAARSVAVVGASTRPGSPGRLAVEFLQRYGYRGRIVPVNPHAADAYPSVVAAGGADLALILVPAAAMASAVDDCVAAGVPVAIVGASGYAETGAEGRAAQDDLVARAAAGSMRLVGPNCIGAAGIDTGQVASFSPLFSGVDTRLTRGGIGFASASGALGFGTVSLALERGMGLYAAVTTGNEADVTAIEVLGALGAEPGCTVLLGYLEAVTDGPGLRALARTGQPIALLVGGRSAAGARAARSHTGALSTPDRVVDGALRQLGIVRVSDVDELLDVGDAFSLVHSGRGPVGRRVAVVTTSGGSGILAADAVAAHGLSLATLAPSTVDTLKEIVPAYGSVANPVDVTAGVMRDRTLVDRVLTAVAADDGVDIVVVCFCVLVGEDVAAIVDALSAAAASTGKPVLVARTGADHLAPTAAAALRAAGIPTYPTPARAVRAAAALTTIATVQHLGSQGPSEAPSVEQLRDGGTEAELKGWLSKAGVRVPAGRVVHRHEDAVDAVREHGGRAVLKAVVPGLIHKSTVDGVALGVTPAEAVATYTRLAAIDAATGVLVEEQVPPGVELLVGIAPSPLGPAITVGAGGLHTELLDDVAVRLLPVTEHDIRDALAQTVMGRLANDAFVDVALRVSELAAALPPGATLDLNPVVVGENGAIVLDAALVGDGEA